MKKKAFRHMHSKIFRGYLASYISVTLIILSVLSVIVMWQMAENMKKEGLRIAESKLRTVVEDLQIQTEAMRRMVVELSSLQEFRLDYFLDNKFREIELLDRLDNYREHLYVCEEYFVKYSSREMIFNSQGKTSQISAYLGMWLEEEEKDAFIALLDVLCEEPDQTFVMHSTGEKTFFCYPMKKYAHSEKGRDGVICFMISESSILERIERVVSGVDGQIVLYYRDQCLIRQEDDYNTTPLEVISLSQDFRILFWPDAEDYFSWANVFSPKITISLFLILLLILGGGFLIAYWNYLPICKITEKYKDREDFTLSADWESLESLLESLLTGKERNVGLLKKQRQILKEQTIRIIASEGLSERGQEYLTLLNIELPGPMYAIVECSFLNEEALEIYERLNVEIERLSGDGLLFYAYYENGIKVFVSAEEIYQLEEATERIHALIDALEYKGNVKVISVSDDLGMNRMKSVGETQEALQECSIADTNAIGWKALEYIRKHCSDCDLSLDRISEEFQITSTYLCYVIKEQTGVSYKKYLTELRMEEAKRLLKETPLRIIDISQATGYNDVSYFIKVFQKHTGLTPAKYRDMQK